MSMVRCLVVNSLDLSRGSSGDLGYLGWDQPQRSTLYVFDVKNDGPEKLVFHVEVQDFKI